MNHQKDTRKCMEESMEIMENFMNMMQSMQPDFSRFTASFPKGFNTQWFENRNFARHILRSKAEALKGFLSLYEHALERLDDHSCETNGEHSEESTRVDLD